MKKKLAILLIAPFIFSLGACNVDKDDIDPSSLLPSEDVEDFVKSFLYDSSVANQNLNALAADKGYSFALRAEEEILPDPSSTSTYYNITLNGKGNLTWAVVDQVDKDNNVIANYKAVYEEDTKDTYVNDGTNWYKLVNPDTLPYSISDIKGMLIVSGQYVPFLAMSGVVKTRTIQINRECIKYKFDREPGDLTVVVDRKTQVLTQLIDIQYSDSGVSKKMVRMDAFNEEAPNAPEYK